MAKDQHSAVAFITPEDKNTIKEKYETAYANYITEVTKEY